MDADNNITTDTFFNGRVQLCQSTLGYRFSLDAVLLAAISRPRPGQRVLDIGTGCGVVPILMTYRHPDIHMIAVELQETLARMAEKNVAANQMGDRVTVINHDVRSLTHEMIGGPVDWVVSNPPYRPAHSGRINPNGERACARHEIHLDLQAFLQACRKVLRTGGDFAVVYPSDRLTDLICEMRSAGIEPKWLRSIHSRQGDEARLALVKGRMRGKPGLKIDPPLIVYGDDGQYTEDVERMMMP